MRGGSLGGWVGFTVAALALTACSSGGTRLDPVGTGDPVDTIEPESGAAELVIDAVGSAVPIDPRLFGTNVPAWAGPERLADPEFRDGIVEVGTTLVRMPGGSWSNAYDWLGCEIGDDDRCAFTWAARPSDFVGFLQATGIAGSWTVNINETAQSAAAAVAFFNGDPADERAIGTDRNDVDWGSVGRWARLRADNGHPEPADVRVWEIGNEVFGGRPDAGGEECASFGWEDVWTCDGGEYVLGDDEHDGYLAIRRAMIDVDPEIEVGAVGVAPPAEWSQFGLEVIEESGDELDFYVLHGYGFDRSPTGDEALRRPERMWGDLIASARSQLGDSVPIAVTEYNLVAFENGDTEQAMTTAQNALFMADTLGQLASAGVSIGNQWNYANGVTASGTDYGLIHGDTYEPYPQWEAMYAWSHTGPSLLSPSTDGDLHVYPTRHDDGRLTVVVVNLTDEEVTPTVAVTGTAAPVSGTLHTVRTDDLTATSMTSDPDRDVPNLDRGVEISFPGWSISRLETEAPAPGDTTP